MRQPKLSKRGKGKKAEQESEEVENMLSDIAYAIERLACAVEEKTKHEIECRMRLVEAIQDFTHTIRSLCIGEEGSLGDIPDALYQICYALLKNA